jgi:L-threonylcarbamoyladenylate synthase
MTPDVLPDPIGDAVNWLREGSLIAFPTETVWGLGADARSDRAVSLLQRWKGRAASAPVSILIAAPDDLESLEFELSAAAQRLVENFWPGPLTLVLDCHGQFASGVSRVDGAVGVRCSSHPISAALARRLAAEGVGPITATSLNRSGARAAASVSEAQAVCDAGAESPRLLAVEAAEAGGDLESTVIDATGSGLRVLRWGAITKSALEPLLCGIESP